MTITGFSYPEAGRKMRFVGTMLDTKLDERSGLPGLE
jgi:hypothetical protein